MAYSTSLSGAKLRAKLGASLNETAAAPTSDFAQRHLESMGWTEGTGLGKRRNGVTTHVQVKRREDQVGLGHSASGAAAASANSAMWWADSVGDTLAKLAAKYNKKKKKSTKNKHCTDEELFQATGGARFGMRAQRRATAKWARTESQSEQEEEEAMARVEWNGTGPAKVLLSGNKRKFDNCTEESHVLGNGLQSQTFARRERVGIDVECSRHDKGSDGDNEPRIDETNKSSRKRRKKRKNRKKEKTKCKEM